VLPAAALAQSPLPDLPVSRLEQLRGGATQPPAQPVARVSAAADLDAARTLSVTFSRPAPIRDVLLLLVRGTPFSTVADASVRVTFSGELRNLTLRQALESVLFPSGLDYDVRGTVIRVFPRRPRTRLFPVDLLAVRRSWQSRPGMPGGAFVSATDSDVFAEIDRGVSALLSPEGRHHVDRRAGLVQVTDFTDRLDQIGVYLETVQLRATRQVRIDVRILRVTRRAGAPAGISRQPISASDPDDIVSALERTGTVTVMASPALLALNNEPAMIRVPTEGASSSSAGTDDPGSLWLVVTPQISGDGFIQLSVVPAPGGRVLTISDSDSVVRVKEGRTVMIPPAPPDPNGHEWLVLLTPSLQDPSATASAPVGAGGP
jgi:type II secretory pathway component HofQ